MWIRTKKRSWEDQGWLIQAQTSSLSHPLRPRLPGFQCSPLHQKDSCGVPACSAFYNHPQSYKNQWNKNRENLYHTWEIPYNSAEIVLNLVWQNFKHRRREHWHPRVTCGNSHLSPRTRWKMKSPQGTQPAHEQSSASCASDSEALFEQILSKFRFPSAWKGCHIVNHISVKMRWSGSVSTLSSLPQTCSYQDAG